MEEEEMEVGGIEGEVVYSIEAEVEVGMWVEVEVEVELDAEVVCLKGEHSLAR